MHTGPTCRKCWRCSTCSFSTMDYLLTSTRTLSARNFSLTAITNEYFCLSKFMGLKSWWKNPRAGEECLYKNLAVRLYRTRWNKCCCCSVISPAITVSTQKIIFTAISPSITKLAYQSWSAISIVQLPRASTTNFSVLFPRHILILRLASNVLNLSPSSSSTSVLKRPMLN